MSKDWVIQESKMFMDVVTRKHIKCDRGSTFQVTNLNRNLTQFRPSEIHCQLDPTGPKGSLRHVTTKNVKDLSNSVLIV